MEFKYKAINLKGKHETGWIDARDRADALLLLKRRNLTPISIKEGENHKNSSHSDSKTSETQSSFLKMEIMEKDIHQVKISKKKMLGVLTQFAIMMKAAVSLSMCLQVLVDQEKDKKLKKILEEIRDDMYSGRMLSYSMGKFKTFEAITINIIAAGEVNGKLDEAFARAAHIMENEVSLTSKVKTALGYPVFLLCLTFVVVLILNLLVLPVFADLFAQMGGELPMMTRMLMASSDFMINYWYLLFLGIGGAIFSYYMLRKKSPDFREKTDHTALKIPVIGGILSKLYISRIARVLASLIDAGVEIIRAIEVSAGVIPNTYLKRIFSEVIEDIRVGISIHQSMSKHKEFEALFVSMIKVGEEAGKLYDVLDKMADLYEEQTEMQTKRMTAMIEPVMTVVIALVVRTVVISVVMHMFGQYKLLT